MGKIKKLKSINTALGLLGILAIILVSYFTDIKNEKIAQELTVIYEKELNAIDVIGVTDSQDSFSVSLKLEREMKKEEKEKVINSLKDITCNILVSGKFSDVVSLNINLREYETFNHIYSRIINKEKCI
jgi:hypothetical protein